MIYITGDIHGDYFELEYRIAKNKITKDDYLIVLGDAGLNYYLNDKDVPAKRYLNNLGIKMLFLHGNHEERAENVKGYKKVYQYGITTYVQNKYPNLIFLSNGIMNLENKTFLVIGGAYSVDKFYRLKRSFKWFESEQLTAAEKASILNLIKPRPKVDYVLTHAAPTLFEPTHLFLGEIDQSTVDKSMPKFLQEVLNELDWDNLKHWYFGHYHADEKLHDKATLLYQTVEKLVEV